MAADTLAPHQRDLIHGVHAVAAALANPRRRIRTLWATRNAAGRLSEVLERAGIAPEIVDPPALERIVGRDAVHQGVALEADALEPPDIEALAPEGTLVLLDQVTDPHNIGAILRVCAAFAVTALITTARHSPAATGIVAKAASGGLEHVHYIKVTNLARTLAALSEAGWTAIGLDGEADLELATAVPPGPIALVLGAEGKGLRRLTRERCDSVARIALPGPVASLNVSTAAAIALHIAAARQ